MGKKPPPLPSFRKMLSDAKNMEKMRLAAGRALSGAFHAMEKTGIPTPVIAEVGIVMLARALKDHRVSKENTLTLIDEAYSTPPREAN